MSGRSILALMVIFALFPAVFWRVLVAPDGEGPALTETAPTRSEVPAVSSSLPKTPKRDERASPEVRLSDLEGLVGDLRARASRLERLVDEDHRSMREQIAALRARVDRWDGASKPTGEASTRPSRPVRSNAAAPQQRPADTTKPAASPAPGRREAAEQRVNALFCGQASVHLANLDGSLKELAGAAEYGGTRTPDFAVLYESVARSLQQLLDCGSRLGEKARMELTGAKATFDKISRVHLGR